MARSSSLTIRKKRTSPRQREFAAQVVCRLALAYPDADCALHFANPLQLLIATILSAQCTDERVNMVTPALFQRFPAAADFAGAEPEEIEVLIHSTGFFRNKAKHIQGACARIVNEFGGEVPQTLPELITLSGVARKTANVVLGVAFGKTEGVVVDTHVKRISGLLGLTRQKVPDKVEIDLVSRLPREEWIVFPHRVIAHGRAVCIARRPRCSDCNMNDICPSAFP